MGRLKSPYDPSLLPTQQAVPLSLSELAQIVPAHPPDRVHSNASDPSAKNTVRALWPTQTSTA